jgi:hypothetical protein
MTIYVLTFKATSRHDAEKRAGLNRFLKAALRSYGLRLIGLTTQEQDEHGITNSITKSDPHNENQVRSPNT